MSVAQYMTACADKRQDTNERLAASHRNTAKAARLTDVVQQLIVRVTPCSIRYMASRCATTPITSLNTLLWI